jgi:hypothetical protein
MKKWARISVVAFDSSGKVSSHILTEAQNSQIKELIAPLNPTQVDYASVNNHWETDASMHRVLEVVLSMRALGFHVLLTPYGSYRETERSKAELLELRGEKGIRSSSKGPLTWRPGAGCPYCKFRGTLWEYEKLVVREAPSGFQMRIVDHHVTIATKEVVDTLRDMSPTGIQFVEVPAAQGGKWFVLTSTHTLSPMASPPSLHDPPLAQTPCGKQHCVPYPISGVYYNRHGLDAKDFNWTYEYFGCDTQLLVISQRIYQALRPRLSGLRACRPIDLVDESILLPNKDAGT